jgi:hypothetical protein
MVVIKLYSLVYCDIFLQLNIGLGLILHTMYLGLAREQEVNGLERVSGGLRVEEVDNGEERGINDRENLQVVSDTSQGPW